MSASNYWTKSNKVGFNTTEWPVYRKSSKKSMAGCETDCVAASGNNGRNPNEDGKTWYVWALTSSTPTATAVAEWEHGPWPVAPFWKPPSRGNDYKCVAMCPCLLITKKWLHFLTNRCIRDPYVQWCERLSRSANCRLGGLLDCAFGFLFKGRQSLFVLFSRCLFCRNMKALRNLTRTHRFQ